MNTPNRETVESLLRHGARDLPEIDVDILVEAIAICDVQTIQEIAGLGWREAVRLVTRFNETKTGYRVRDVFCTPDARSLVREMLTVFSRYAVTPSGRLALASLTPSLNGKAIEEKFNRLDIFLESYRRLEGGKVEDVLKVLTETKYAKFETDKLPTVIVSSDAERTQLLKKFGSHVKVEVTDSGADIQEIISKEPHILSIHPVKGEGAVTVLGENLDPVEVCPGAIVDYYGKRRPVLETYLRVSELLSDLPYFQSMSGEKESVRRVLSLLDELREVPVSLEDTILEAEERINDEIKRLSRRGGGMDELKLFIEDLLFELADRLDLERDEVNLLREAAYETQTLPFSFSSFKVRVLSVRYGRRRTQAKYMRLKNIAAELEKCRTNIAHAIQRLFELDFLLSIARLTCDYDLNTPRLNDGLGIGFEKGRNLFLIQDQLKGLGKVEPVSYSIGESEVKLFGAETKLTVMLTGANSGGKTTLLEALALMHILALLGLPIPADKADIPLVPLYLFRRRTVRKVGSLEYAIRVLRPIMGKRRSKVLLMDEFEALTEPGALGRILASILNDLPRGSLTLFVTHLAREILPYLKTPVRVDGIEAKGIDDQGNLVVDRQPIFNHLGTSTPHLIITKLSKKTKNKKLQQVYQNMISLLEARTSTA